MENTLIKERICNLLESIVDKTENINRSFSQDYLIEVDLVIDELKQLYNEFYLLKKYTEDYLKKHPELEDKGRLDTREPASRTFPRTFVTPPPGKEKDEQKSEKEDLQKKDKQGDSDVSSETDEEVISSDEKKKEETSEKGKANPEAPVEEKPPAAEKKEADKDSDKSTKHSHTAGEDKSAKQQGDDTAVKDPVKSDEESGSTGKNKSVADLAGSNKNEALGDKYVSDEDTSLNVRLATMKQDVGLGTSMQHNPIVNLKDSIGVNEKFLFINELFEGDIEAYNEAVNKLNSFNNLDEAFDYINQLNDSYSWDGQNSSETIDKFAYLVQRRYMNK